MEFLPYFISFYDQIDVFLVVLVRVLAFFMFVPVLSGMSIPLQIRLFLAVFFSAAIFTSGVVTAVTYHDSTFGLGMLLLHEFMTGALMGFVLLVILNAILFAGQLMDFSIGFSMVNVLDPIQQIQVPIIGNFMFMSVSVLLVVTGGLNRFIQVFYRSYQFLQPGTAIIIGNQDLAQFIVVMLLSFLLLAVQIAIPIVGALLIVNVILGIMVKAVPQMNVFVVGMPLKVLVGIFLMFTVMAPALLGIYDTVFYGALETLEGIIRGMTPSEY